MTKKTYNYTDTFRSSIELAIQHAEALGIPFLSCDLLLWGILEEGTNSATHFLSSHQIPWQELKEELHLELSQQGQVALRGETPTDSPEIRWVLTYATEICSLLGDDIIRPRHLLFSLYFVPSWPRLRDYLQRHGLAEDSDSDLQAIASTLPQPSHATEDFLSSSDVSSPDEDDESELHKQVRPVDLTEDDEEPQDGPTFQSILERVHQRFEKKRREIKVSIIRAGDGQGEKIRELEHILQILKQIEQENATEDSQEGDIADQDKDPEAAQISEETTEELSIHHILQHYGKLIYTQDYKALDTLDLYKPEMTRLSEVLLSPGISIPILVANQEETPLLVIEAFARALERGLPKTPRQHPYFTAVSKQYSSILLVDACHLLSLTQRGRIYPCIDLLLSTLKKSPGTLLCIQDLHLLAKRPSQPDPDLLELLFLESQRLKLPFIGIMPPAGYQQVIAQNARLARQSERLTISPPPHQRHRLLFHRSQRQLLTDHGGQITFSHEEFSELCLRYFPTTPFPYLLEVLFRKALGIARERSLHSPTPSTPLPVSYEELYRAVCQLAGIHTAQASHQDEVKHLKELPARLKEHVIGQDYAIDLISRAIQRARLGLQDERRPLGAFLFLGTTGVGKTLLAKRLSYEVFGSEESMVRIDMSELTERHTISRLIGSPPGYVGYGEGGQLTSPVLSQPNRLILFDEVEKAHPDIYNLLLQLLDEGRLTDGEGQLVDFRHTLIILTSNVGSRQAQTFPRRTGFDQGSTEERKAGIIRKELERTFSPEFLGRLDEIITFNSLSDDDLKRIVSLELEPIKKRLKRRGYTLRLHPTALHYLAQSEEGKSKGARFVRQRLRQLVEDRCTEAIISGELQPGQTITLSTHKGKELIHKITPTPAR